MKLSHTLASLLIGSAVIAGAPPAWAQTATDTAVKQVLAIDSFTGQASAYTGGNEIFFALRGTPGGTASVKLSGTDKTIALTEDKPGEYSGSYTVRTRDKISASSTAKATLTVAGKSTSSSKTLAAAQQPVAARQGCEHCGVVQSVRVVEVEGKPGYGGAIAGGVAGAVLGSQVGGGDGRTLGGILGAAGGAYAGREVEKRMKTEKHYEVTVRLNNGQTQTVEMAKDPHLAAGAQVRIEGGAVVPNN